MIQAKHGRFHRGNETIGGFLKCRMVGEIELREIPANPRPFYLASVVCDVLYPMYLSEEECIFSYTTRNTPAINQLMTGRWCEFYFKRAEHRNFRWFSLHARLA